eukprot:319981-Amphidinium_carterae.1
MQTKVLTRLDCFSGKAYKARLLFQEECYKARQSLCEPLDHMSRRLECRQDHISPRMRVLAP